MRNTCARRNVFANPTSDPMRRAASWTLPLTYVPEPGIDRIVPRIADDRRRHRRQADLREQAIDQQLVRRVDAFVEDPGALNLVAGTEPDLRGELPRHLGAGASTREVEARARLLLDRAGDNRVGRRPEHPRLAVGAEHAILGDSCRTTGRQRAGFIEHVGILQVHADAGKEADRPVLPEDVPPRDLERPARRDIQALRGRASVVGAPNHAEPPFGAGAEHDRRGQRFFDGDQHVALALVAMGELGDLDAAEQAERRKPAAALDLGRLAERVAGLDLQLALDGLRARAHVADDQHVIHEDARPQVAR